MKKLLFSLSLLASLASFADGVECSAQVTGVMPVTASTKDVIVSVPWIASGYDTSAISVSNIIKTANLTVGDTVKIYNATVGAFNVWTLTEGSSGKYWAGVNVIGTNGVSKTGGADVTTIARGGAMILTRNSSYTSGTSYTFYLIGQYCATAASDVTVVAGTEKVPVYTLIAPPGTTAVDLNDPTTITISDTSTINTASAIVNDCIWTSDGKIYRLSRDGSTWRDQAGAMPAVQPGTGFWYVSRGGTPKFTFK